MAKVAVLTFTGEEWAAGRLVGTEASAAQFIGWGTGGGTAFKGDTALAVPASEGRVAGTVTLEGDDANAVYQVLGTLTADSPKTITNVGTFTALTLGKLIIHASLDPTLPLGEGDTITFKFTINPG